MKETTKGLETEKRNGQNRMAVVNTIPDDVECENVVLCGAASDIGKRGSQQDAVAIIQRVPEDGKLPSRTFAVLCDGMGGMASGEKASNAAVQAVMQKLESAKYPAKFPEVLKEAAYDADDEVYALQDETTKQRLGAGTTLTAVTIEDNQMSFVSVGDSRIYLIRNGMAHQLTEDHNVMYRLEKKIRSGEISIEEANATPKKEALISYIGMGCVTLMTLSQKPYLLKKDDYILMCSDGLYRTLSTDEMIFMLELFPEDMQKTAESLISAAVGKGYPGQDNTTVAILKYI